MWDSEPDSLDTHVVEVSVGFRCTSSFHQQPFINPTYRTCIRHSSELTIWIDNTSSSGLQSHQLTVSFDVSGCAIRSSIRLYKGTNNGRVRCLWPLIAATYPETGSISKAKPRRFRTSKLRRARRGKDLAKSYLRPWSPASFNCR